MGGHARRALRRVLLQLLHVRVNIGNLHWTMRKRYSEFYALSGKLKSECYGLWTVPILAKRLSDLRLDTRGLKGELVDRLQKYDLGFPEHCGTPRLELTLRARKHSIENGDVLPAHALHSDDVMRALLHRWNA